MPSFPFPTPFLKGSVFVNQTLRAPTKLWNASYILVLIVSTLSSFSFYMVATIMSKYLVSLGATIAFAGFVVGLFSITSLVCRPFCGVMADRMNNIWLLIVSNLLMSAGLIGFALSDNMPSMILFRILNGVGFSINGTVQMALIIHFIPNDRLGEGIGYVGISQLVGSACAPALGLEIADKLGMSATFLAAAGMTLLAAIILLFLRGIQPAKEKQKKPISFRDILEIKALPYTIPYSTFSFTNGIINGYLVMFADMHGIAKISIYFTLYAVAVFLVRPISGKLMDKKGLRCTVFPGMIICALSLILLGFSSSLWMILATGILRALGQGSAQPSLQAGCINYVGRDRSGVATSTYFLGGDIGQGIGPMIGGFLLARVAGLAGYRLLFSGCAVLMLATMVYFYFFCKKEAIR